MINILQFAVVAIVISLAGGLGSVLRLLLSRWTGILPWGILAANSIASLFAGLVVIAADGFWAAILVTGVMGGLSTFSSWAAATGEIWQSGKRARATSYGVLTLVIPTLMAWGGQYVATLLIK
jgi:CrcB protein